jgi:cytochrome c oxidase assembly protein subunit 11
VEDVVARVGSSPETAAACAARTITVTFNADVADGLPWRFTPAQRSVTLRPGESALAFYTAVNTSEVPITGVSTYNVAPARAGLYFRKVQCFCFEEQRLEPGETVDMPVLFYLDPEFVDDRKCDTMHTVTLSYTFWKAGDTATEQALEVAAGRDFEADALEAEGKTGEGATVAAAPAVAPAQHIAVASAPR